MQPLIDQGVLAEGEVIPPSEAGGKPATKLWFSKDARPICAVLLLHDRVSACLVSLEGEVYAQHAADFPKNLTHPSDAFRIISTCVEETIASGTPILVSVQEWLAGAGLSEGRQSDSLYFATNTETSNGLDTLHPASS
ncbi:hypothetical protein ACOJBO_09280 [Rhizobium beringeri]